ncbi:MAG: hypothetical protein ACHBN1_31975 [Heteroscytonema crispum UTEX LB 1556]
MVIRTTQRENQLPARVLPKAQYWFTNNQQSTTNNQQPTTNNQQSTINNQQSTINNQQPTTNNQQPTKSFHPKSQIQNSLCQTRKSLPLSVLTTEITI